MVMRILKVSVFFIVAFRCVDIQGNAKEAHSRLGAYEKKKKVTAYYDYDVTRGMKENSVLFLIPKYLKEGFSLGKNKVEKSRFLTFSPLSPAPKIFKKSHFRFPNAKRKKNNDQTEEAKNIEGVNSKGLLYFNQKDEKFLDQEDKKD